MSLTADFIGMKEAISQWKGIFTDIFHVLKEKNYHPRILRSGKISPVNESERHSPSGKSGCFPPADSQDPKRML